MPIQFSTMCLSSYSRRAGRHLWLDIWVTLEKLSNISLVMYEYISADPAEGSCGAWT